jgi:L-fuconate dehydratase
LGEGNRLVCEAIELLSRQLLTRPIEDLMAEFGSVTRQMADDPMLRWLGPHKGVVHLALASITNACFDLWAKSRGVPLWRLLLDLSPEDAVRLLDLSSLDEVLNECEAVELLRREMSARTDRELVLRTGYPGYDTSVGWMAYDDANVKHLTKCAMDRGFNAFKLKVGSKDQSRDLRRAASSSGGTQAPSCLTRTSSGHSPRRAKKCAENWPKLNPLWIEEPTHPDDLTAHVT